MNNLQKRIIFLFFLLLTPVFSVVLYPAETAATPTTAIPTINDVINKYNRQKSLVDDIYMKINENGFFLKNTNSNYQRTIEYWAKGDKFKYLISGKNETAYDGKVLYSRNEKTGVTYIKLNQIDNALTTLNEAKNIVGNDPRLTDLYDQIKTKKEK